jgi:guanosine-3',5'-bis(diphosphate) 3'-pyrophosphohydrolase
VVVLRTMTRAGARRSTAPDLAELAALHRQHHRHPDLAMLAEAYRVAARLHQGQTRESGTPFITHPVAVARIVAELGLDTTAVAAALLHDTVEDTMYTLAHLRTQFGEATARLVDGVTKFDKIFFGEVAEAETFRKMILAAATDIRVLIIKVADRLHNMRTIRFKPPGSQVRTATVTRDIFIPFADRLGLYVLRRELEDLVLAVLEPEAYRRIEEHLQASSELRAADVATARQQLLAALRRSRIRAQVHDRPRHHYSIYREMLKHPHGGPRNPPRLVVVTSDRADCYAALGAVHQTWRHVPGIFHDMIAAPKYNLYQSLHTSVIGPGEQPMDVLIRTRHMHRLAEVGVAADLARHSPASTTPELEWLTRLLTWQHAADPQHFLDALRSDLAQQDVTLVTVAGTPVTVPAGSTCLDLAYHLDPIAADRLIGARINGKLTPLATAPQPGDEVELIHTRPGEQSGMSEQWLAWAHTPHARLRIAEALSDQQASLADQVAAGKTALAHALQQRDRALPVDGTIAALAQDRGYPDQEALFLAIYLGKLEPGDLADNLISRVDDHANSLALGN